MVETGTPDATASSAIVGRRPAIAQGADAIVGPNRVPEAMDPAFRAVTEAGIPLIICNAGGLDAADRPGAMIPAGSMAVAILSGHHGLPIAVGILGALTSA